MYKTKNLKRLINKGNAQTENPYKACFVRNFNIHWKIILKLKGISQRLEFTISMRLNNILAHYIIRKVFPIKVATNNLMLIHLDKKK